MQDSSRFEEAPPLWGKPNEFFRVAMLLTLLLTSFDIFWLTLPLTFFDQLPAC